LPAAVSGRLQTIQGMYDASLLCPDKCTDTFGGHARWLLPIMVAGSCGVADAGEPSVHVAHSAKACIPRDSPKLLTLFHITYTAVGNPNLGN